MGDILEAFFMGAIVVVFLAIASGLVYGIRLLYETQHYILFGISAFVLLSFVIGGILKSYN